MDSEKDTQELQVDDVEEPAEEEMGELDESDDYQEGVDVKSDDSA